MISPQTVVKPAILIAALLLILPTVITYTPYQMGWEELYFSHRALSLNQAFWTADFKGMEEALSIMAKSPVMAFLSLPWGPIGGTAGGVGLVVFTMALLTWIFIFISFHMMKKTGVPDWVILLASLSVFLNPFLKGYAGRLLIDQLVSWIILSFLLLISLELEAGDKSSAGSFSRGCLWGAIVSAGLFCKVTFIYFMGLAIPIIIFLKWRKDGIRYLGITLFGAFLLCLPSFLIWMKFGKLYLGHAWASSWGPRAIFYAANDTSYFAFWERFFHAVNWSVFPCAIILVLIFRMILKRQMQWTQFLPAVVIFSYLFLCSTSQNSDLRFLMPVMIALPFTMAAALSKSEESRYIPRIKNVLILMIIVASVPMTQVPKLDKVHELTRLFSVLKHHGVKNILMATDSTFLNTESLLLSKEFLGKNGDTLKIATLVYDDMHARELEYSFERIDKADAVLFEKPLPKEPSFTNKKVKEYHNRAVSVMGLFPQMEVPDVEVFLSTEK
ncbi:hypothetical protein [Desulfonema magnum]|uniref:Uncharacterized protein n=1 Tax=Desulfonema magnum TaxID=45655 RepID=A0A975GK89_9BACT|nr:hypothetical protein [Desulfonema magnum]QTA84461.1 Uncharacterized protein dnm_004570 [Desulfonema magnum]